MATLLRDPLILCSVNTSVKCKALAGAAEAEFHFIKNCKNIIWFFSLDIYVKLLENTLMGFNYNP
jgi:hypothetical protein